MSKEKNMSKENEEISNELAAKIAKSSSEIQAKSKTGMCKDEFLCMNCIKC